VLPVTPALPAAEGGGSYVPLPEGSARGCTHCGAPARYVRSPTSVEGAVADRPRLCERCYRQTSGGTEASPLDDPEIWNPPEGGGQGGEPEPIPAIYVTPPEPDLPDLPQPDAVPDLDEGEVAGWVDRLCAAEVVRSPGTRYAEGTSPAALRAELRNDLGTPSVQQAWDRYRDARRQAWERECATPRYEGEHRRPALEAEAVRLASEGYNSQNIYHGLLTFNQGRCLPPIYETPPGSDGEVRELQGLAEETYQSLPLSALRVEAMPEQLSILTYASKGLGIQNDLRGCRIWATTTREGETVRDGAIVNVALTDLTIRSSPRGATTIYEATFVGQPRLRVNLRGTVSDILGGLEGEGLVAKRRAAEEALAVLVQQMREGHYAHQTEEEDRPGIYPARYRDRSTAAINVAEDGLVAVERKTPPLTRAGLRSALELLDQAVVRWFGYTPATRARMAVLIRWFVIAPFAYVRKHRGLDLPVQNLILTGNSRSGKSQGAQVGLALWGIRDRTHMRGYEEANTEARLGEVLASSAFPVLIDEVDFSNERIHPMLKLAHENLIARTTLTTTRQQIHREALAPLCLTTNGKAPIADAVRNRSVVLRYDLTDFKRIQTQRGEFDRDVKPRLDQLSCVGSYTWEVVCRNPQLLHERDWGVLATAILSNAYRYAGLNVPAWVDLSYDDHYETDTPLLAQETVALALRDLIQRRFGEDFQKWRNLWAEKTDLGWERQMWSMEDKLAFLLATGSIPALHPVRGQGRPPKDIQAALASQDGVTSIRIDQGIFQETEFRDNPEISANIGADLRNLAEVLGVETPSERWVAMPKGRSQRKVLQISRTDLVELIALHTGEAYGTEIAEAT